MIYVELCRPASEFFVLGPIFVRFWWIFDDCSVDFASFARILIDVNRLKAKLSASFVEPILEEPSFED